MYFKFRSILLYTKHLKLPFKNVSTNVPANDIAFCFVGNGAEGNPRSLFLNYYEDIFIFNCGEGVQRLIIDLGFKSSKINTLFTTSNKWSNFNGLSSLLLARYDAGIKELNVHNKSNSNILKHCTLFDAKLKRCKFNYVENNFVHEHLTIKSVPINFCSTNTCVFLGSLLPEKGKINLEKCFRLNVPRNLVSELENGNSIINKEGKTIHPSDVCFPDRPEQNFMIFECLDPEYLNYLFNNGTIKQFLSRCDTIVHFTNHKSLSNKNYQEFINKHNFIHHFLITETNRTFSLYSTNRFQIQLNQLDSKLFPLLKNSNPEFNLKTKFSNNVTYPHTGLKYVFRSPDQISTISHEKVPSFPTVEEAFLYKDGSTRDGIEEQIKDLKMKQNSLTNADSRLYPEFVFLGTASSFSLPIRNVPAILVNLNKTDSILLDCGENTYGQLLNFYGYENIGPILTNLKAIFVSHHHSDHHTGLIKLLEKRQEYTDAKTIWVLLPPMVDQFLKSNILNMNYKFHYFIPNNHFKFFKSKIIADLSIKDITLIPVNHCAFAYGLSIVDDQNFKFVYSGDTQPSDRLVKQGLNCDLLIHEATVEDNLTSFARTHFHSTISEAINIGKLMHARFTILTHFSQRYGKLPFLPDQSNFDKVGIAFDNMRVNPSEFIRLPLLYEPLKIMYSKHLETLKYRSNIYNRKYGIEHE